MDGKAQAPRGGRFVWHELLSTDPLLSTRFYRQLFDWRLQEDHNGQPVFAVAGRDGESWPVASLTRMDGARRETTAADAPQGSYWLACVLVERVEAAATRLQDGMEGVVAVYPEEHAGGRHAVVADRRGALFATFARSVDQGIPREFLVAEEEDRRAGYVRMPAPGCFCWDQLNTRDLEAAAREYGELLGWTVTRNGDEGDAPTATFWRDDGGAVAGALQMPAGSEAPDHWVPYVRVTSVEQTVRAARELGAGVLVERTCDPRHGCFAILEDPAGAVVAVCAPPLLAKNAAAVTSASAGAAV